MEDYLDKKRSKHYTERVCCSKDTKKLFNLCREYYIREHPHAQHRKVPEDEILFKLVKNQLKIYEI